MIFSFLSSFVTKDSAVQRMLSRRTFIKILNLDFLSWPRTSQSSLFTSHSDLLCGGRLTPNKIWFQKNQQFWRYGGNVYIMNIRALIVTLTMKIIKGGWKSLVLFLFCFCAWHAGSRCSFVFTAITFHCHFHTQCHVTLFALSHSVTSRFIITSHPVTSYLRRHFSSIVIQDESLFFFF